MPEDEPLEHGLLTRTIESAQKKVEGNNFAIRKHVLKYDDVMNKQREVIYGERRKVLEGENIKDHIFSMAESLIETNVEVYTNQSKYPEEWDLEGLKNYFVKIFGLDEGFLDSQDVHSLTKEKLVKDIMDKAEEIYISKEKEFGEDKFREIERIILLQVVDSKWMDHIDAMDQLRQGIGLRAYGQEDPVRAYQIEGFDMFEEMNHAIWEDTISYLYHIENSGNVERKRVAKPVETNQGEVNTPIVNKGKKIGRNDPCPCGSGKKYKKCCGSN